MIVDADVGIKTARVFYNLVQKELENTDMVTLDFINVKRVDLSILQIVIALARSAKNSGKTVRLKSVSDDLRRQMRLVGLKV